MYLLYFKNFIYIRLLSSNHNAIVSVYFAFCQRLYVMSNLFILLAKLPGKQQSLTDLTSQAAASLNKADSLPSNGYIQVQDQKTQGI